MLKLPKRKKPGRPTLPKGEAKGIIVPVRFNLEERKQLEAAAEKSSQNVSQWIRNTAKREVKMTNLEKVGYFLEFNSGKSFCDDCIAEKCGISNRRTVQAITHDLEFNIKMFKRYEGPCETCTGKQKKVIQALVENPISTLAATIGA